MKNNRVNAWKLNDCDRNNGIGYNSINKNKEIKRLLKNPLLKKKNSLIVNLKNN